MMASNIKPQKIIVKAVNIHLIQDLLVSIVEKFNHGGIETFGSNNKLVFSYWATDIDHQEINQNLTNCNFDIEIEMVVMFREVEE